MAMISSFDGTELAVHRMGKGRAVLMLHGLFSSAEVNWIKYGTAKAVADAGSEAIMADLRGHGLSGVPQGEGGYPADVLVRDAMALVEALELEDYDLAGFSLGARTAVQAVIAGLRPRRLVLGGMGLEGLGDWQARSGFFIDAIDRFDEIKSAGDPAYFAKSFMRTMGVDRPAMRLLLQSVQDVMPGDLARVKMPTLVVCGAQDQDNGSAAKLAETLPDGRYVEIPGNHMSSVTQPELAEAMIAFLNT